MTSRTPSIYATEPVEWVGEQNSWFARNPWNGGPKWVTLPPIYAGDLLCLRLR